MAKKKEKPYYVIDDSILNKDFTGLEPKSKKRKPKKPKHKK